MNNTIQKFAVVAALVVASGATFATKVTPPPLPPGSALVKHAPGLNDDEKKRFVRAHHHKMHNKRDFTKDDSEPADKAADKADKKADNASNANSGSSTKK